MTKRAEDLKVLHVMAGAEQGGAETFLLDATLALAEAGLAQHVVTRPDNAFRVERMRDAGIAVTTARFDRWWPWPTRAALRRVLREFRPHIAQYWMGRAGQFARRAAGATGPVNVGWYGGYYKLERFKHCDLHVAVTEDIRANIVRQGAAPRTATVIHTYAEFPAETPVARQSLDTPEGAPLLLALARLHWKKGLDVALEALVDIPSAYLWIAGSGPLAAELKTLADRLGVGPRVRFLGWRNDRAALLAAADIVVFPSRYEPFGTVSVEAWAARRPLVAAASQGPKAYVEDGVNGLLVPIDDVAALRDAIVRVLSETGLEARLVAGGTATYEAKFNKAAFVRDSLAFYGRIANGGLGKSAVGSW